MGGQADPESLTAPLQSPRENHPLQAGGTSKPEGRKDLAGGLNLFKPDPLVTSFQRNLIASLRSIVLALAVSGILYAMVSVVSTFKLSTTTATFKGAVFPCPNKKREAQHWPEWLTALDSSKSSHITFTFSDELQLQYYQSEEMYKLGTPWIHALSMGLWTTSPSRYFLSIPRGAACLQVGSEAVDVSNSTGPVAAAKVVMAALAQTGLRQPRLKLVSKPWTVNGALLLKGTAEKWTVHAWDQTSETWVYYHASRAWMIFEFLFFLVLATFTGTTLFYVSVEVYYDWSNAVRRWTVQYDFLWSQPTMQLALEKTAPRNRFIPARAVPVSDEESNTNSFRGHLDAWKMAMFRLQMCSVYFVIDNFVGNAFKASEQFRHAILSALLHAVAHTAFLWLPAICAAFVPQMYTVFLALVYLKATFSIVYGIAYYFGLQLEGYFRQALLGLQLTVSAVCFVISVTYFCAILIFGLTLLAIDPDKVLGIVIPLASTVLYIYVVTFQMKSMADYYAAIAYKKQQPEGLIQIEIQHLGLGPLGVFLAILEIIVLLCILTLLMLATTALNSKDGTFAFGSPVPAIVVPSISFLKGMILLMDCQRDMKAKLALLDSMERKVN